MANLDLEADVMPVIKKLGISWESTADQFTFVVASFTERACLPTFQLILLDLSL